MNEAVKFGLISNHFDTNGHMPEWLLLINSDTLFPAHSLRAWLTAIKMVPRNVSILAPLTNNAGNAQKIVLNLQSSLTALNLNLNECERIEQEFKTWAEAAKQWIDTPTHRIWPIERADFFCIAIRTSVWQQLGGLDPIYGRGYYEDFDFSLRAVAAGYQCALTDDCLIFHQGSASFKASAEQKKLIRDNHRLFKNRFPNAITLHTRQSNLTLLQAQLAWIAAQPSQANDLSAVLMRIKARWQAAHLDRPRSWVKRWMWQRSLSKLQKLYDLYLSKPNFI
jgi:GT2 family glycosyltransferase